MPSQKLTEQKFNDYKFSLILSLERLKEALANKTYNDFISIFDSDYESAEKGLLKEDLKKYFDVSLLFPYYKAMFERAYFEMNPPLIASDKASIQAKIAKYEQLKIDLSFLPAEALKEINEEIEYLKKLLDKQKN